MTAEQLEELPISEDSLQSRIGDIGNCTHNLSCEYQDDEALSSRMQEIRGKAWGLSIDVGALERRVIAADGLLKLVEAMGDASISDSQFNHMRNVALTAYRESSK